MALMAKKKTIKMGQGNLKMKYATGVQSNTEKETVVPSVTFLSF